MSTPVNPAQCPPPAADAPGSTPDSAEQKAFDKAFLLAMIKFGTMSFKANTAGSQNYVKPGY